MKISCDSTSLACKRRHTRIDREPKEELEKGKRHLNLIAPFLVPERKVRSAPDTLLFLNPCVQG